jgi:hypothetical protein
MNRLTGCKKSPIYNVSDIWLQDKRIRYKVVTENRKKLPAESKRQWAIAPWMLELVIGN